MLKENKFYNSLEGIFQGAKIEGKGGFVNLLKIKEKYYKKVLEQFRKEVNQDSTITEDFKEDFYDKLCNFFDKYFSESGSIYFVKSANWQKVYEKIYTDNKDVVLFWKTNMLYYIKSDKIFENQLIKVENEDKTLNYIFKFDVSQLQIKQNNEKKNILYTFKDKLKEKTNLHDKNSGDTTYIVSVDYEANRKKTKIDELASEFQVDEYIIDKAIKLFEKQNSIDFFINKNAKLFLDEQLDMYLNQILLEENNCFEQKRLMQIKTLKKYAKKLINFISGFENELVKIWNKPKFALNSNYVITLDKLNEKSIKLIKKHSGLKKQIEEWKLLKLVKDDFKIDDITLNSHLPIDTKYFKNIEIDLISCFENLDEQLDGRIIHTENYQGLNTLKNKYESQIQCIYIDPPFNTGYDFEYVDNYQDSSWLSILNDRLTIAKHYLKPTGGIYLHLDRYANYYGRILLNNIFLPENYKAELYWDTCGNTGFKHSKNNWYQNTNCILHYAKNNELNQFNKQYTLLNVLDARKAKEERKEKNIGWLDIQKDDKGTFVEMYNNEGKFEKKYFDFKNKIDPVGMIWTDILSFLYTQVGNNESYFFNGGQKPEHLLARMIQAQTRPNDIVMDFYAGSGTSIAVAKKLNRKFLGFELGSHWDTFYDDGNKVGIIGRLKHVLTGDEKFYVKKPYSNDYSPRTPQLTRNLNWKGGGAFKYYELEQYEDSLSKASYNEKTTLDLFDENIYNQYTFFADKKMLANFDITKDGHINIKLDKLFKNIDLPETISNILGLPIKKITKDKVIMLDDQKEITEKYDYNNMTEEEKQHFFNLLKPYLWWGE